MKILYLANARIPTEKAHGVAISKMVEALAKSGHQVTLIMPKRRAGKESIINQDLFSYYRVEKIFKVRRLFCFDLQFLHQLGMGKLAFYLRTPIFLFELFIIAILNCRQVIYTRDGLIAGAVSFFNKQVFFEPHRLPNEKSRHYYRGVFKRVAGIITINRQEKENLIREYHLPPEKVIAEHSAIDLKDFELSDKNIFKKKLGIPLDKTILSYVGKINIVGREKKLDDLIFVFKKALAENSNLFLLIGGLKPEDLDYHQKLINNENLAPSVKLLPHVPFSQVKEYYAASDIFLLPYAKFVLENLSLSPMKLFEYAASRRPIICSEAASIKEIFNSEEIVYFKADDYDDLKVKILDLSGNASRQNQLAAKAFDKVKNFTWQKRAENISVFINNRIALITRTGANLTRATKQ